MTPYYEHAGIQIWHGDCREILPQLPKVAHVFTDPPYEEEAHTAGRRLNGRTAELRDKRIREIDADPLSFSPMSIDLRYEVSSEIARISSGWALVFCQAEAVNLWRLDLANAGAKYRRAMVWIKPDSACQESRAQSHRHRD